MDETSMKLIIEMGEVTPKNVRFYIRQCTIVDEFAWDWRNRRTMRDRTPDSWSICVSNRYSEYFHRDGLLWINSGYTIHGNYDSHPDDVDRLKMMVWEFNKTFYRGNNNTLDMEDVVW